MSGPNITGENFAIFRLRFGGLVRAREEYKRAGLGRAGKGLV